VTSTAPFVPDDFKVPEKKSTDLFIIESLHEHHNQSDYEAWTSSRQHIKATPGFSGQALWVDFDSSLADNAASIAKHSKDFAERAEFNYAVVDPSTGEVIGSVYIRPSDRAEHDADVRSWVRADRAELDKPLYDLVTRWLADAWPFREPEYARR
jgi:hypothetical protein